MYGYRDTKNVTVETLDYSLLGRAPSQSLLYVVNQLERLPENSHVLDLGCGEGILEYHTDPARLYDFTAVDIEPAAIDTLETIFAKQGHTQDMAVIGDILDLGEMPEIKNKRYDAVISWRVLHGISPDYHPDIFKHIHGLLKPGSSLFITVASNKDWKARALGNSYTPQGVNDCSGIMFRDYGIERFTPFPVHFFSQQELISLGQKTGFSPVATHLFQEPSGYTHLQGKENTYLFVEFTT
jgi:SAM-dependent methyltransferase